MYDNMRASIQLATDLAYKPGQGPTYSMFRDEMRSAEDCCKQAAVWRQDTRWYPLGNVIAQHAAITGKWLRGYKVEGRLGKTFYSRDLYLMLAENLGGLLVIMNQLKDDATGRVGPILPEVHHFSRTQDRPMQVMVPGEARSPAGILLPAGLVA
jgi:hypothetical protein